MKLAYSGTWFLTLAVFAFGCNFDPQMGEEPGEPGKDDSALEDVTEPGTEVDTEEPTHLTFEDLYAMDREELADTYQAAAVPAFAALDGDYRATILLIEDEFPDWAGDAIEDFITPELFAFDAQAARAEIRYGQDSRYQFENEISASFSDDGEAYVMSELTSRLGSLLPLSNELREVAPDLYLGRGYVRDYPLAMFVLQSAN